MRHLIAVLLLMAAPLCASAQERQYAVLSLVGDHLLIVQREMGTGSRIDQNRRHREPIPHAALDRAMLLKPKGHDFVLDRDHTAPALSRHMSVTGG